MASVNLAASIKDYVIALISRQPDDSSFDEIMRELLFAQEIQLGLKDSEEGKIIPSDEVKRRLESWRT